MASCALNLVAVAGLCVSSPPRTTLLSSKVSTKVCGQASVSLPLRRLQVIALATPSPKEIELSEKIAEGVANAQVTCDDPNATVECAAAWDEVEELSTAAADLKAKAKTSDPLEEFCEDNPEADECRVYSD
eukprot:TRINITY_DN120_c0_g1_i3.p1 TRINITY_DN120_c0_g1~~TRINITY_DN120_c0_g1_i3.p1  ORF type:complete len:144 (-),score=27.10 TRINITY_DN120_c0_g1_i3:340-732(-)